MPEPNTAPRVDDVCVISVRLPVDVHRRFTAYAAEQRRTMSAQAVLIIEQFLDQNADAEAA